MSKTIKRLAVSVRRFSSVSSDEDPYTGGSVRLWRNLVYFVVLPSIGLGTIHAYLSHKKHEHDERPPFIPYEYMYIRRKRFPWGDGNHSLFHNPKYNALPDGYEDEK